MPSASLKLSPRAKALFDSGKLNRKFKQLGEQSGEWYLGRHQENKGEVAPLDRGFSQRGARTKDYPAYSPDYREKKKTKRWLYENGDLLEYVRSSSKVTSSPRSFKITVPVRPSGKGPEAYAGIHNHGGIAGRGAKIPKREYLRWDNSDKRSWRTFATKWLNQHLGFAQSQL